MDTSSSIFLSISEKTTPGKRRFLRHSNLEMHYRLDIGILEEDADTPHERPYRNPLTVAQAVEVMRKHHPGLDILKPLREARDEIRNYIKHKVFTPFSESRSVSAFSAMRRYRGKPMLSTVNSDDGYDDFIGIEHDIFGSGKTVRRRLEEYGKYWVDIIREYILGLDFQLADRTMKNREYKERRYPGIYSYPLGIDQPAVETGLVFNSIKYKVTNLSSQRSIQRMHEKWKREGLRKSSGRATQTYKKQMKNLSKSAETAGFENLMFDEMTIIGATDRSVPALNTREHAVLIKVMEKFKRSINRKTFPALKLFIARNAPNLKSAEKILVALPFTGYVFEETATMVTYRGSSNESSYKY